MDMLIHDGALVSAGLLGRRRVEGGRCFLAGDADVGTGAKFFLRSASDSSGAVGAHPPVVASHIAPLQDAPAAFQIGWQLNEPSQQNETSNDILKRPQD